METTLVAAAPAALTAEQWIERTQKGLELLRIHATLTELLDNPRPNARLVAWYQGRSALLAQELGL